jgi:hypothetical protein
MSKYDIIRRNRETGGAVKSYLFGLGLNIMICLVAMTAAIIISIVEMRTDKPGDMFNIIFGYFSVLIFVGGFAVLTIIMFIVGTWRFHQTKRDYPNTKQESMVNFATLCLVVLLILFVTQVTGGVILKFFAEGLIEIWGTVFFIIGGLAYGLFFTFMIYAIYRSNLLLFIGLACSISGGILFPIFPPLLPIMGFVGSMFFFFAYFHLFIIIGHSIEDPTLDISAKQVEYKIRTERKKSQHEIKYEKDDEFDLIHKPYSAHDDGSKAYFKARKKREKELDERKKALPKRIPKMMRFEQCPHCHVKLPKGKDLTHCPKCKEELFPT